MYTLPASFKKIIIITTTTLHILTQGNFGNSSWSEYGKLRRINALLFQWKPAKKPDKRLQMKLARKQIKDLDDPTGKINSRAQHLFLTVVNSLSVWSH